jgi:hypothetical protein
MKIINALLGTASQIRPNEIAAQIWPILVDGEQIVEAFKVVRDLIVFTQCRLILVDKQGITGKKVEYHSIPYKSIIEFSVETAGRFDLDSELKIYTKGNAAPLKKKFKRGACIIELQKVLASYVIQ